MTSFFILYSMVLVLSHAIDQQKHQRNVGFWEAPQTPGGIQHIRFENGTIVDPYAIQIGLPPSFSETIRDFANQVGISDLYKEMFFEHNVNKPKKELTPGTDRLYNLEEKGGEWFLQRPAKKWQSNMHWLNCNNEEAHDLYLALLSKAGFDVVLEAIGSYFNMNGIDVYSAGFIGVTHCEEGFLHTDFEGANGKAFNVLIPLELVDGSEPEFLVQQLHDDQIVRVHYEHDVALAVGDNTIHATADCDYRYANPGKMRMAMSIYLADIDEDNVDNIITHYTDPFPPNDPQYLLNNSGRHWRKDGSASLPKEWNGLPFDEAFQNLKELSRDDNVDDIDGDDRQEKEAAEEEKVPDIVNSRLMTSPQSPGEIDHIRWENGVAIDPYVVEIGLPKGLTETMLQYCQEAGIIDHFKEIFYPKDAASKDSRKLKVGKKRVENFDGATWYMQRPEFDWNSNMYWMSSNDERSHERYLSMLQKGGFDVVLDAIGRYFNLDGIDVYSVGFIAETHCEDAFMHTDFAWTNGKAFNVLIPLEWEASTNPDVLLKQPSDEQIVGVHYEKDVAIAIGEDALYATSECDYRSIPGDKIRLTMTIYLADIDEANVLAIADDLTDPFPPGEPDYLLSHRGRHWKKDDESAHLPEECLIPPSDVTPSNNIEEEGEDDDEEEEKEEEKKDPKHWTEFDRNDFWYAFDCPQVFKTDRPVPTDATWTYLRETYVAIVGEESSSISPQHKGGTGGFHVPVEARLTKNRGRGIFATEHIRKGSLVWNTMYTARFPDSVSYRKFMLTISPDLACEAMPWSYIQMMPSGDDDGKEKPVVTVDMDIGALINSGTLYSDDGSFDDLPHSYGQIPEEWEEYANVGCIENDLKGGCKDNYFALRDIYPGEEIFVHYAAFANVDAWWGFGLKCSVCDVHMPDGGYSNDPNDF